ncbi:hypothetical protein EON81_16555 [bacterium]|nr:MAG: hypothetical protein EON81_16555 [bacterium]
MTLQVPFARFAETVRRHEAAHVYLAPYGDGALATASFAGGVVAALAPGRVEDAREKLAAEGLSVNEGQWEVNLTQVGSPSAPLWVAAVVYPSSEGKPGVWIDAYEAAPTEAQVLRAMYDEFVTTGQTEDVGFDPFLRLVNPQVVVVAPDALVGYARAKGEGC